ncbi:hypothetical protein ACFP1I_20935 [Dyadobacter subterraneus]|uniref:DUF4136 domain-containing protein n=1 Tax=Dyadobacter subterraneus TaxID=2773304 RepID=A0ABR9W798_9BACT|nr:hypothetical protein [Dyadobacter subterraneus]MBE9461298.1 hypothetical protein [Dyadobacter subterraneus]
MNKIITVLSMIFFWSCSNVFYPQKKIDRTEDMAVNWVYAKKVNPYFRQQIDSVLTNEMAKFNQENHSYHVHEKTDFDKSYLNLNFTNGKIVGNKERFWGYITFLVGNIAAPATLLATGHSAFSAAYLPYNKIKAKVTYYQPQKSNKENSKKLTVRSGALFGKRTVRLNRVVHRLARRFHKTLLQQHIRIDEVNKQEKNS